VVGFRRRYEVLERRKRAEAYRAALGVDKHEFQTSNRYHLGEM
jgi:hypothetical protein